MGTTPSLENRSDSSESDEPDLPNLNRFLNIPGNQKPIALTMQQLTSPSADFQLDAAITSTNSLKIKGITTDEKNLICQHLDTYEKISVVYLIANSYEKSLELMIKLLKNELIFDEFLAECIRNYADTQKLIEALCVIQNYEVLKMLDYQKSELITDFTPLRYNCSIYLNKIRKVCYSVMEKLTPNEESALLEAIKEDLVDYNIDFPPFQFCEMHFAYLFEKKYIEDTDLSNLIKHFKSLEMDECATMLQLKTISSLREPSTVGVRMRSEPIASYSSSSGQVDTDKSTANEGEINTAGTSHSKPKFSSTAQPYPMDAENPGLVLIIENIDFFEDYNDEYKGLVITSETALESREGSNHDSKRLKEVFTRFGFDVIHKQHVKHIEMIQLIIEVTNKSVTPKHSSFILIMLSHGQLNKIIACNSIPVDVNDIKRNINSKTLEGKPKILIFQACQGTDILSIESNDICTDGPSRAPVSSQQPWQKHILEFWSAVPGVVSFRSKSKGSWMIQTLCDVLESPLCEESFVDICTEVNRLIGERWVEYEKKKKNVMLTNLNSTLDKKFILPSLKN